MSNSLITDKHENSNRELLELAAKAAGLIPLHYSERQNSLTVDNGITINNSFAPLTDDGDALRLAVKLEIDIEFGIKTIWANAGHRGLVGGDYSGDPCESLRRAITGAAAEIGRAMP